MGTPEGEMDPAWPLPHAFVPLPWGASGKVVGSRCTPLNTPPHSHVKRLSKDTPPPAAFPGLALVGAAQVKAGISAPVWHCLDIINTMAEGTWFPEKSLNYFCGNILIELDCFLIAINAN